MGIVESIFGNVLYKLLMPKEVPDWYNDRRKLKFPEAPPDSLLLLGDVVLYTSNAEAARQFYFEALGGGVSPAEAKLPLHIPAGASQIRLLESGDETPRVWPGHVYLWVDDIYATLERCKALQAKLGLTLVEDVHNITALDTVDALELRDPDGNAFLVNQAPKDIGAKMKKLGTCATASTETPNVLALIEAVHTVPPGAAPALARFYRHFLGAAVSKKKEGAAVHFSAGRALRQTLLFAEEEPEEGADEAASVASFASTSLPGISTVYVYLPSKESFDTALEKCREADILDGEPSAHEFRMRRCLDPQTHTAIMEMETIVRLRDHTECPLVAPATS